MRLISLHLRNYRLHLDTRVEFDASHNLIGGPNESGKSTLMEAAHRALFLNHRRGGNDLDWMRSRLTSAPPEVDLEFEQHGTRYHLKKTFQGTKAGSRAELRSDLDDQWTGTDAENQLAHLLGLGGPLSPKDALTSWAHLWIRQGASSSDPTAELNTEQSTLLARLQEEGGAALMQSELDAAVGRQCAETYDRNFTSTGAVKAGSELKQAEAELAEKKHRLAESNATAERLEAAIQAHEDATRQLKHVADTLPELEQRRKQESLKLEEATKLQAERQQLGRDLTDARSTLKKQTDDDRRIRDLAESSERLATGIEPLTAGVARLREQRTAAGEAAKALVKEVETATAETRRARHHRELLQQQAERLRIEASLAKLTERLEKIASLRKDLEPPKVALAKLPKLSSKDLDRLRTLEAKAEKSRASLEAIAAGVEWIGGDGSPTLDEHPLEAGVARTITEPCELVVADNHFRIRPGGGASLEQMRTTLQQAETALRDALETLGVTDTATAARQLEERNLHTQNITAIESRLETLEPDEAAAELERGKDTLATLVAEVDRLQPLAGERQLPPDAATASAALAEAGEHVATAEAAENAVRGRHKSAQETNESLGRQLESSVEKFNNATTAANEARIQHDLLVKEHGEQDARRERIVETQRQVETLQSRETAMDARLKELQPELLEADLKRLARAIAQQHELRNQAQLDQAAAGATLRSDGVSDPYAALDEARQGLERAKEFHASALRRANATRLLHQLFEAEHQKLSDQITAPLAQRISEYLQCLFGPQARARVQQNAGDFQGLELVRAGGPFQFDELSGGTKEQLAAGVRLAMAELLAEDHGGCLPIVFDDAFTNSDPDRIAGLQRMLDFAAGRGLQVIVLTCTPIDYAALGAHSIALDTPRPTSANSTIPESPAEPAATPQPPTDVPRADIDTLLDTLSRLSGKSGNQKLRETLGWDETRYNDAKDFLIQRGDILPGRGRGGSVGLSSEP